MRKKAKSNPTQGTKPKQKRAPWTDERKAKLRATRARNKALAAAPAPNGSNGNGHATPQVAAPAPAASKYASGMKRRRRRTAKATIAAPIPTTTPQTAFVRTGSERDQAFNAIRKLVDLHLIDFKLALDIAERANI